MVITKSSDIKAWEQDLHTSYTSEQWQKVLHTTYAATKSVNLRKLTSKILLRWYLTPFRMSKFDIQTSPLGETVDPKACYVIYYGPAHLYTPSGLGSSN